MCVFQDTLGSIRFAASMAMQYIFIDSLIEDESEDDDDDCGGGKDGKERRRRASSSADSVSGVRVGGEGIKEEHPALVLLYALRMLLSDVADCADYFRPVKGGGTGSGGDDVSGLGGCIGGCVGDWVGGDVGG